MIIVFAGPHPTKQYNNIIELCEKFNPIEPIQNFNYLDTENNCWMSHFEISKAKRHFPKTTKKGF